MYRPAWFREDNVLRLHDLIRDFSFATLVTNGPEGLVANHLPFLLDADRGEFGVLRAHMARSNPQWQAFTPPPTDDRETLIIFEGPHAYISPSWYVQQPSVPTWNYAVVHAYGTPRLLNAAELRDTLQHSVTQFEAGSEKPWALDSLSDEYVETMQRGIVGLEIVLTRLEGKFKLSQNRSPQDQQQVIAMLQQSPRELDRLTAAWMQEPL